MTAARLSASRVFLLVFALSAAACSTAPPPKEFVTESKNKAAEYAGFGNDYFSKGMYARAIEFFKLSLAYSGSVDHRPGIAKALNSLGKVFQARGLLDTAENYLGQAEEIAVSLDDPQLTAQTLNNRGELELAREEYEKALAWFEEARDYAEKAKSLPATPAGGQGLEEAVRSSSDLAVIYHNIGTTQKRLGDSARALEFFQKALELNLKDKFAAETASNYYMIASVHSEKGEYEKALANALLALEMDKKVENSLGIAKDFLALGIIAGKSGEKETAYDYFKRGLFVYRSVAIIHADLNIERDVATILEQLVATAEALGKTAEAANYRDILQGKKKE
jgi:tetratricopeptide (TPR) repeat protein